MKCERCNGLIIAVSFVGSDDAYGVWKYDGLKCLNCGHITDPLLKKNREFLAQNEAIHHLGYSHVPTPGLGTLNAA